MSEASGPPRLAVTIVARDEEDRLPATLASAAFADEIVVVVDAATTDRTAEVARAGGAKVIVRTFDGFGPQKNAAADATTAPWILSVDADEVVLPELAAEITAALATATAGPERSPVAYRVPIHLEFLGRVLRFGRDTVVTPVRLYRRDAARWSDAKVHERVVARGPVAALRGRMLHRSYRDLTHYLEKLDLYTTLGAEAKAAARRSPPHFLFLRVVWEFLDRSILHLGVFDGTEGLTYAALSSGNTLFKYLKLRSLAR
jgi:glycosyltransferase involved in cell wall biosynthesis